MFEWISAGLAFPECLFLLTSLRTYALGGARRLLGFQVGFRHTHLCNRHIFSNNRKFNFKQPTLWRWFITDAIEISHTAWHRAQVRERPSSPQCLASVPSTLAVLGTLFSQGCMVAASCISFLTKTGSLLQHYLRKSQQSFCLDWLRWCARPRRSAERTSWLARLRSRAPLLKWVPQNTQILKAG